MKIPCCSICQTGYNEQDRCPLLLQCGHGFCKDCLSKMFSAAATGTTLPCPRCRHVTLVGNSVQALKKNYAVLALIVSSSSVDLTDEDEEDDEPGENGEEEARRPCSRGEASSSSGCGAVIELGLHGELKLVRRIGEGRRGGVEMWAAVVLGGGKGRRRCRHRVAVKKLAEAAVEEGTDWVWVQGQLEGLRKASMWCRNVCAFHGVRKVEGCLSIVMDICNGSVQTEMRRNEGRLTLEQILW